MRNKDKVTIIIILILLLWGFLNNNLKRSLVARILEMMMEEHPWNVVTVMGLMTLGKPVSNSMVT